MAHVMASSLVESARLQALQASLANGEPDAESVFWADVAASGAPLVEAFDADGVDLLMTFLWRETADEPVDHVALCEFFSPGDPGEKPMERLGSSSVWFRSYHMVRGLRAEYAFWVNDVIGPLKGSDDAQERLNRARLDPLNPDHVVQPWMTFDDPSGEDASVFALPGAEPFR